MFRSVFYPCAFVRVLQVNTLVRIGLQLLGLILIYTGSWTLPPAFATVVGLLLLHKLHAYLAVRLGG